MKIVATKIPFGIKQETKAKIVSVLNKEFDKRVNVKIDKNKVLLIEYKDLDDSDLFSMGMYISNQFAKDGQ